MTARLVIAFLATTLSLLLAPPASAAEQAEQSLVSVMEALSKIGASKAAFIEERHVSFLSTPLILEGTLSYEAGLLEKHALSPKEELMRIEGDRLTITAGDNSDRTEVRLSDYPALDLFITALRATLRGDLPKLESLFDVDFASETASWRLRLTPKQEKFRDILTSAEFWGAGSRISQLDVLERNGDRTIIKLRPIQ